MEKAQRNGGRETEEGVREVGDVAARSSCAVGEEHLDGNVESVSQVEGT